MAMLKALYVDWSAEIVDDTTAFTMSAICYRVKAIICRVLVGMKAAHPEDIRKEDPIT